MIETELNMLADSSTMDITYNFFLLVKDAPKEELLEFLERCTDENLKGELMDVYKRVSTRNTEPLNTGRFSLAKWFGD